MIFNRLKLIFFNIYIKKPPSKKVASILKTEIRIIYLLPFSF